MTHGRAMFRRHFRGYEEMPNEAAQRVVDEAATIVARRVANWPSLGDQNVTASTIRNWRDQQRALPVEERKSFDRMKRDLLSRPEARKEVEALLRNGPPGIPKS